MTLLAQAATDPTSWLQGGIFTVFAGLGVYVLNYLRRVGKDNNETIEKVTQSFTEAVRDTSKSFEETATTIHRECRESSERREAALHDLVREKIQRPI